MRARYFRYFRVHPSHARLPDDGNTGSSGNTGNTGSRGSRGNTATIKEKKSLKTIFKVFFPGGQFRQSTFFIGDVVVRSFGNFLEFGNDVDVTTSSVQRPIFFNRLVDWFWFLDWLREGCVKIRLGRFTVLHDFYSTRLTAIKFYYNFFLYFIQSLNYSHTVQNFLN